MSPLARRTQRSLDRLFVEPRPSIETARLFSHIGRSPEVFAQYQARVALEVRLDNARPDGIHCTAVELVVRHGLMVVNSGPGKLSSMIRPNGAFVIIT